MSWLIAVTLLVLLTDQFTKVLIRRALSNGESISIIDQFIQLKIVENSGGAFGIFPGSQIFLFIISSIVIAVAFFYWLSNRPNALVVTLSFGLIIGGALGNMIDRLMYRNVTDFIDFKFWPVFNIADLAIVLGMILFLNSYLKDERDNGLDRRK